MLGVLNRTICGFVLCVMCVFSAPSIASGNSNDKDNTMEYEMTAKGSFELQLAPQVDEGFPAGRMTIDKTYSGDLDGKGLGQMLSERTAVEGSAGYVAIEHFKGTLGGRSGTFSLQHTGTMNKGASSLSVTVIPDSGTGDLAGLSGEVAIDITEGQHYYVMNYTLSPE